MTDVELMQKGIADLGTRLAKGSVSSRLLVETCLQQIEANNDRLHAFVEVFAEEAMDNAEYLDAERRAGRVRGRMHGIPVAIKDLADIAGRRTGFGSCCYSRTPAKRTAAFVQRLQEAGAIILGKTQLVEFAFGSWGTNYGLGTPINPRLPGHAVPGGSSSGSAVAVAAGLVPVAVGSDTGGSVRIPAALCGIVGMKPAFGVISNDGVAPLSPALDAIGPMANLIEDIPPLLEAMGATCRQCAGSSRFRTLALEALEPLDDAVRRAYTAARAALEAPGEPIVDLALPMTLADYQKSCG